MGLRYGGRYGGIGKGSGMGRSVTSNEPDVERAGEMSIEWSLRPQATDDASAMRRIFLASRRATLDESGFDEATVERLTSYQFDLERADFGMSLG